MDMYRILRCLLLLSPRVSWPLRHRGRLACTRSLERRTAGCVLFVTCYLFVLSALSAVSTHSLVLISAAPGPPKPSTFAPSESYKHTLPTLPIRCTPTCSLLERFRLPEVLDTYRPPR